MYLSVYVSVFVSVYICKCKVIGSKKTPQKINWSEEKRKSKRKRKKREKVNREEKKRKENKRKEKQFSHANEKHCIFNHNQHATYRPTHLPTSYLVATSQPAKLEVLF